MSDIFAAFTRALIKDNFFDNLGTKEERNLYEGIRYRKDNEWYKKYRVAVEIMECRKHLLAELLDRFYEDLTLVELLKNKKNIYVTSIPNTRFSLLDYFFCKYLEEQFPNLKVTLIKMVPVDEYQFMDFDHKYTFAEHQNFPSVKQYVINVSEDEVNIGHLFVLGKDGEWK